jgi:negative regulator of flagellin synthesis FlgM
MKIGPSDIKPATTPPAASPTKDRAASVPAAGGVPGAESSTKVDLSPAAGLSGGLQTEATFDTAKVDRIAQAIKDGNYKVNAEAIADKLIINAAELLGRKAN